MLPHQLMVLHKQEMQDRAVYDKEYMVVNKARNWKCMEEV
jgi:hypothetical protein